MNFKKWLEAQIDPYGQTIDFPPEEMETSKTDQNTTVNPPTSQELHPNSTLDQIAQALNPLDIDNQETGYSGTPNYSAPEQSFSTTPKQPDLYQMFLKDLPSLFPNNEKMIREMLNEWLLFKSELLRKLGNRQYMNSDRPRYPIHYALPLRTLKKATHAFEQVNRILKTANDPALQGLGEMFFNLFAKHSSLKPLIEEPLKRQLSQTRNDPTSFDNFTRTGIQRRPPAA